MTSLFRAAAVEGQRTRQLSEVVLVRPIALSLLVGFLGLAMTLALAFVGWGTYTERVAIRGHLTPDGGVYDVYSPASGTIVRKERSEGALVTRGEVIFVIEVSGLNNSVIRRTVIAPVSGRVLAVEGEVAQSVELGEFLMSLVPDGASLRATFLTGNASIRKLKKGDRISMRYPEFPYQQFGLHEGTVISVSTYRLPATESSSTEGVSAMGGLQPIYRVIVDLDSEFLSADSESYDLDVGMPVEADVPVDSKRLYRWLIDGA